MTDCFQLIDFFEFFSVREGKEEKGEREGGREERMGKRKKMKKKQLMRFCVHNCSEKKRFFFPRFHPLFANKRRMAEPGEKNHITNVSTAKV